MHREGRSLHHSCRHVTIYAGWEAQQTTYTVAYFKEVWDNASNTSKYVYDSSKTFQAEVGATVTASSKGSMSYYDFDASKSTSAVVSPDGKTVVNGYYTLKRYTIVFDLDKSSGRININGQTWKDSDYKIENVVLGQDVSFYWPAETR